MSSFHFFTYLSAVAFISYGSFCLVTDHMKVEFERYGLSPFRKLVGTLELLGGLGLLLGAHFPMLHIVSSAGLSILMLLGVYTRWRVRDPIILLSPALLLMLLNLWIFIRSFFISAES